MKKLSIILANSEEKNIHSILDEVIMVGTSKEVILEETFKKYRSVRYNVKRR